MALVNMAEQFQGLPMESLIGGPLKAAAQSQIMLARSTAEFITTVGFDPDPNDATKPGATRYVTFTFDRPAQGWSPPAANPPAPGGPVPERTPPIERVQLEVPLLAIVPVPNLQIDTVDIVFDMEVKSSETQREENDLQVGWEVEAGAQIGPFHIQVKVNGQVKQHKEYTRSSDNSARYHVEVHATNHGMPEGLARVFDIMASSIAPKSIKPV
jgi:hypothetical protein